MGKGRTAMSLLKNEIMDKILLRRTKLQCADVLALPPRCASSRVGCIGSRCIAMSLLKNEIMDEILLRRTKLQCADVLALPLRCVRFQGTVHGFRAHRHVAAEERGHGQDPAAPHRAAVRRRAGASAAVRGFLGFMGSGRTAMSLLKNEIMNKPCCAAPSCSAPACWRCRRGVCLYIYDLWSEGACTTFAVVALSEG